MLTYEPRLTLHGVGQEGEYSFNGTVMCPALHRLVFGRSRNLQAKNRSSSNSSHVKNVCSAFWSGFFGTDFGTEEM